MDHKRIVVTGLGAFVSNGRDLDEFRRNLFAGVHGLREIRSFDTTDYRISQAAILDDAEVAAVDAGCSYDRATLLAHQATREAVEDAGLEITGGLRFRTAVTVGSSLGGMLTFEDGIRRQLDAGGSGDEDEVYRDILEIPPCRIASFLGRCFNARGGAVTVVTACSAGSNSIAVGADLIRRDRADVVLACGTEPFGILAFSGFNILMALSRTVSRPFDRNREGLTLGEGAGTLILEEYEHARARGARIYAELAGYGLSNDAFHPTQPDPQAGGACRAILRSLADAGAEPADVGYINAHGTATRHNDVMELKAISQVYGEMSPRIPISSIKPMIGHTLGAAGTIEAIATVLSLHHRYLPPTVNFQAPEAEYPYDFVPQGRAADIDCACSHSFGFGGNAACLVFRRLDENPAAPAAC